MKRFFICLILFGVCIKNSIGTNTLLVKNDLNSKLLGVRCRSKDDNLGDHVLQVGQMRKNEFDDNVWRTTLFWCNFWKGPDWKIRIAFDAYSAKWKKSRDTLDDLWMWVAREDGIYFTQHNDDDDHHEPPVKKYDWPKA